MSTIDEQVREARRELKLRLAAYPRFVLDGRMTQQQADKQISLQQDIVATLQGLALAEQPSLFAADAPQGRGV